MMTTYYLVINGYGIVSPGERRRQGRKRREKIKSEPLALVCHLESRALTAQNVFQNNKSPQESVKLTMSSSEMHKLRGIGRRMAETLNLNYFDERNISTEHRVRHYRENITSILQDQEESSRNGVLRTRWDSSLAKRSEVVPTG